MPLLLNLLEMVIINHVNQKTIVYLGKVEENQIPYLKAAYASDKPKLVYKDGTVYEG